MIQTPLRIAKPQLIHGETTEFSWQEHPEADQYKLDIVYDDNFDWPMQKRSFNKLENVRPFTWKELAQQYEALTAYSGKECGCKIEIPCHAQTAMVRVSALNARKTYADHVKSDAMPVGSAVYRSPACLHVPPLIEGDEAEIAWEALGNAVEYTLDLGLSTQIGLDWRSIHHNQDTWSSTGQNGLTWEMLHNAEDMGEFYTVYRGPGETGSSYDNSTPGVTWGELGAEQNYWEAFFSQTWQQIHQATPHPAHKSCKITIPMYAKRIYLRIRAFDGNDYSQWFVYSPVNVVPVFEIDSGKELYTVEGKRYNVQLNAREIVDFAGKQLKLRLGGDKDTNWHKNYGLPLGRTHGIDLIEHENNNQQMRFTLNRKTTDKTKNKAESAYALLISAVADASEYVRATLTDD